MNDMTDLQSGLRNGLENAGKLGRQLFDLNNATMVKFVELSSENFKKYVELNSNYVSKLPEVNDISSFVELQREYGQNLWEGMQADVRARGEIVREAVEQTGSLVRGTFEDGDVEEVAAPAEAA
jgi:hypothetical protein